MSAAKRTEEWPIYNCHIHTFTRKHTPRNFIKFVLSDSRLGRINLLKTFLFLILLAFYVAAVYILGYFILLFPAGLGVLNAPAYALLLLLEGLLTIPLLLLAFMVPALIVLLLIQAAVDAALDARPPQRPEPQNDRLMNFRSMVHQGQKMVTHPNILVDLLVRVNPASSNDIFERIARFLRMSAQPSQRDVFRQIREQYQTKQTKTKFVVLPMDMTYMKLGTLRESIECQHDQLLELTQMEEFKGQIIPFYAADPRQPNLAEQVRKFVVNGPFRGIKIYPNLGYPPSHEKLMEIYEMCVEHDIPVMTHCSPGGVWQYGLARETRRAYSQPAAYIPIFKEFPTLKLCLAHFGGADEWVRRLNRETDKEKYPEEPWVRTIYDMIADGETLCPNLFTDISYTAFTPRVKGLYVDLVDYLKVLLSQPRVRTRVLFGSDYYMVEQEKISEKEASVLLRSRLGEDLYKQIAYFNPMEYLGESPEPVVTKRKSTRRRPGDKKLVEGLRPAE